MFFFIAIVTGTDGAALMALDGLLLGALAYRAAGSVSNFLCSIGVLLWHRDRHWWAGLAFGLAFGCKWSAVYFVATNLQLISLVSNPSNSWIFANLIDFYCIVSLLNMDCFQLIVYVFTWTGWFVSNRGWDRQWSSNPLIVLVALSPRDAQLSYWA